MTDGSEDTAAKEQLERRRLARLTEALPVFAGFVSPEGHLSAAQHHSGESFLWNLPIFAYNHASVTQIIDVFDQAAKGVPIQIERPYLKDKQGNVPIYGRALFTVTPIINHREDVEEFAVTLIDCDEAGLLPADEFAKSRLALANQRIRAMLEIAQLTVQRTRPRQETENLDRHIDQTKRRRDTVSDRLEILASAIDIMSDLDQVDFPLDHVLEKAFENIPKTLSKNRFQRPPSLGNIPVQSVPLLLLLFSELISNARQHGAWQDEGPHARGHVALQSDIVDGAKGRILCLYWIEDGGPRVETITHYGFGHWLGTELFPQLTGGTTQWIVSEDGVGWTFKLPLGMLSDDGTVGMLKT